MGYDIMIIVFMIIIALEIDNDIMTLNDWTMNMNMADLFTALGYERLWLWD